METSEIVSMLSDAISRMEVIRGVLMGEIQIKKCLWCGKDITYKRDDALYCTATHKANAHRQKQIELGMVKLKSSKKPGRTKRKAEYGA